ncbi:MAG: hypothetical protein LV471_11020 [Nitrosomonas sp.]|nr:hypothetical protein [Nitrosomonas sp.]
MNKEEVRKNFPECCSVADEFRKVFGNGVRLIYAKENGMEIGKLSADSVVIETASGDFTKRKVGE